MTHYRASCPTPLRCFCALLLSLCLASPGMAQTVEWLSFIDVTDTKLSADSSLGSNDTVEKDLIAGDMDKDGDTDLLIVRKVRFSNAGGLRNVLLMNENGVLTDRTATLAPDMLDQTDDRDVVLVDLNGDTWPDLVTATTFTEQPRIYMNLGENGSGTWLGFDYDPKEGRLPTFSPGPKFCALAAGDVTGDDRPDIYFVDYDNNLEDRLLINNGNGFFTDETTSRMTLAMYESVFGTDAAIVDIDGDDDLDIIKNNASGSSPPPDASEPAVRIFYNDGSGNFTFMQLAYTVAPYMIEVADFDQNGRQDIYVVDDAQDAILFNTGNDGQGHAQFNAVAPSNSPATNFFGGNTKVGDLDGDGILEILVADVDTDIEGCNRKMTILRGTGTPPNITYSDPLTGGTRNYTTSGTFDVEVLDWNGDGQLDIFAATCTGNVMLENVSPMFFDGFESGDTSDWSSTTP